MQWFRKSASFLCCWETVLKCFLVDWEINQIKDSKADDIVNCREKSQSVPKDINGTSYIFLLDTIGKASENLQQMSYKIVVSDPWKKDEIERWLLNILKMKNLVQMR